MQKGMLSCTLEGIVGVKGSREILDILKGV